MLRYFATGGRTARRRIDLSNSFAEGVAGTIHHVIGERGRVVKLYKDLRHIDEYQTKVAAMLAGPPNLSAFTRGGRSYVQIAWPIGAVLDDKGLFRGFIMPEIDLQASTALENMLQKSARNRKGLPGFYGARVLLSANLAALMAELHTLGHYMIDMKPINMRCYPDAGYMALLDTDGFSINATPRVPAHDFSDEYIAPEAHGKRPDELGLEQDLFALAVIIFRLLNNGIHPYQGSDAGTYPTSIQERIFGRLYAYGVTPHARIKPSFSTIHEFFEAKTRALFDRSFDGPPQARPRAAEWAEHLQGLINDGSLMRCAVNPSEHGHFSGGCGFCDLNKRPLPRARQTQYSATVLSALSTAPIPQAMTRTTASRYAQPPVRRTVPSTATTGNARALAVVGALMLLVIGISVVANQFRAAEQAGIAERRAAAQAVEDNMYRQRAEESKRIHSVLQTSSAVEVGYSRGTRDFVVITDVGICVRQVTKFIVTGINGYNIWFGDNPQVIPTGDYVTIMDQKYYVGGSQKAQDLTTTSTAAQKDWDVHYGDIPYFILPRANPKYRANVQIACDGVMPANWDK